MAIIPKIQGKSERLSEMNSENKNQMKVSDLIVKILENNGVKHVFGVLGDIETDLAESLRKSKLKFIAAKNEKSAAFMADIYARVSQTIGICFSTVGPGATNLLSGLANANQDRSAVIALSDQLPTSHMGLKEHQFVDFDKLFHPSTGVTKWNKTLQKAEQTQDVFREAFKQASSEFKGSVHIGLPVDLLAQSVFCQEKELKFDITPCYPKVSDKSIQEIYQKIRKGKGIIFLGGSVKRNNAQKSFVKFLESSKLPVISSFMGKGTMDEEHDLYLGTISRHLHDIFKAIFAEADFILNIGYDFSEGVQPSVFGRMDKLINIDAADNSVPGRYEPPQNIFGDLNMIFSALASQPYERNDSMDHDSIRKKIHQAIYGDLDMDVYPPRPHRIMEAINAIYGSNSIIVCDVGLNKYYAGLLLRVKESSQVIFSNGMSSMAFSSGALAAKLARPERDVIVITGDGGFLMDPQEVSTCVQYNVPLTILVLNNSGLGLVEKKQKKSFGHGYEVAFGNPDYVKFAEAFGAQGYSIRSWAQLEDVLTESRRNKKVNIIDVPVDYSEGL